VAGQLRAPLVTIDPLAEGSAGIRSPLVTVDPLAEGSPNLVGSFVEVDALAEGYRNLRTALVYIESLHPVAPEPYMSTDLFPGSLGSPASLPGLAFTVKKQPKFSTVKQVATSGVSVRRAQMQYPIWEFELTYEFLEDRTGATSSLKTMMGFFLQRLGGFDTFLYKDPDDYLVTAGPQATTDGVTTQFAFKRTLGGFSEKVGQVDNVAAIHLYLDGVLVSPSLYTVTMPNLVVFTTAPAAGKALTADFQFYFACIFQEDQLSFEKFMDKLWQLQTVTFESVPQ